VLWICVALAERARVARATKVRDIMRGDRKRWNKMLNVNVLKNVV
jgi:hypothetical protein